VLERLKQKNRRRGAGGLNRTHPTATQERRRHEPKRTTARIRRLDHLHLRVVLRFRRHGRLGILFAPIDIWIKAYFAMGARLLVQSCITMTKTLRDVHEGSKLVNRIEDARAERLLMGIERGRKRTASRQPRLARRDPYIPIAIGDEVGPGSPSLRSVARMTSHQRGGKFTVLRSKTRYICCPRGITQCPTP
jgi:hypothetical protein